MSEAKDPVINQLRVLAQERSADGFTCPDVMALTGVTRSGVQFALRNAMRQGWLARLGGGRYALKESSRVDRSSRLAQVDAEWAGRHALLRSHG